MNGQGDGKGVPPPDQSILLSFIGNNDCQPRTSPGAILRILEGMAFDRVYLLYNHERYLEPAAELTEYCRNRFPDIEIRLKSALAQNPTDYNTVYPAMFQAVSAILEEAPQADYTISLTSGTPVMHACWIFLQQGGVIPARLIQVSRESGLETVSFSLDDFPQIEQPEAIKAEMTRLARENRALRGRMEQGFDSIIGQSRAIARMKARIRTFAQADIPVLIRGETGTGKELVAKALHYNSHRKDRPLIPVNCGAIASELAESAFFGHKKGAFTGAVSDQPGFIRQADGGTLFLDEIGEMPLALQVKLLRFLDYGAFVPVGQTREQVADVRVIAASHRDLSREVREKRFREDLFYRLASVEISVPPLRDRGEDKALLARHFLAELNARYHGRKRLGTSALQRILSHPWPGNVRQLKGALEAAYLAASEEVTDEDIRIVEVDRHLAAVVLPEEGVDLNNEVLPAYYRAAMERTGGNAEQAARLLGLKPHTFRARLKAMQK